MEEPTAIDPCEVKLMDPERVLAVQAALPTVDRIDELEEIFDLLGDGNRLRLLTALLEAGELCVCDLAAATTMSESAVSHALRLLRLNRVVKVRRSGRMGHYSLEDDHVRMLLDIALQHIDTSMVEGHQHGLRNVLQRALWIALGLNLSYMLAEIIGGVAFNSLALLADAAHMLSDVGGLGIALYAQRLMLRPSSARHTYGFQRAEVLGALANAVTLLAVVGWVGYEATNRLTDPEQCAMLLACLPSRRWGCSSISVVP